MSSKTKGIHFPQSVYSRSDVKEYLETTLTNRRREELQQIIESDGWYVAVFEEPVTVGQMVS